MAGYKNNAEFAGAVNITRQALDFIFMRKTTTFKTLSKISEVLGVDGKDLLK